MIKLAIAPIIGITCSMEYDIEGREYPTAYAFDYLKRNYYEAVEQSGGIPMALPNSRRIENVNSLLKVVDGLLISGGNDVDPACYGEERKAENLSITPERDHLEMALVNQAHALQMPMLAICRGMQLANVVFGGSLYQDSSFEPEFLDHTLEGSTTYHKKHPVIIKEGSKLFQIVKERRIMVNTSHHQMVKNVGTGLVVSAWSEKDGVIEALETEDDRFLICVQWHPELLKEKSSAVLFDALIQSADEFKSRKSRHSAGH
ncbi:MAG: gamma-glutamyl-gamma-aminobutyrate hydrolase family protein [Candidatus Zixiibacteriota bacterium]